MARLQDFPTVTPTSSDKLLVVQSQSQGLVPYGSKLDSANPTGTGYVSMNRTGSVGQNSVAVNTNCTASGAHSYAHGYQTTASGNYSHAEGNSTIASKSGAHAEGSGSTASGDYSHAEGNGTTASGARAHAENYQTTASGDMSHAEGYGSVSSGAYAHAEGRSTIANHLAQHTFGQYNEADTSTASGDSRGNYIEIVGKGTADNARSNARTLDWNGNEVLAGGLKINGNQDVATEVAWGFSMANNMIDFGQRTKIIKSSHFIIATLSLRFPDPFTFTNSDTKVVNFTTNLGIGDALKNASAVTSRATGLTVVLKNDGIYLGGLLGAGCSVNEILPLSVAFAF